MRRPRRRSGWLFPVLEKAWLGFSPVPGKRLALDDLLSKYQLHPSAVKTPTARQWCPAHDGHKFLAVGSMARQGYRFGNGY